MLKLNELLKNQDASKLPPEHVKSLEVLLYRMNIVRAKWGKPMTVTSGYRSIEDHLRIYKAKGITDQSKIPMRSKHLFGQACDILDADGELNKWCKMHNTELSQWGLWLEERQGPWQHFQCVPFSSYRLGGTIWFYP